MSGGSWDYFYINVQDAAYKLKESNVPLRRAFGCHLLKVASAFKAIEWVDSGDWGDDADIKAITDAMPNATEVELQVLKEDIEWLVKRFEELKGQQ
jgi:hypothetical protein